MTPTRHLAATRRTAGTPQPATGPGHRGRTGWKVEMMSGFLMAVAVAVAAALLERLAVQFVRSLWNALQPAA